MPGKLFQRRVENFVCEHCGASVVGDGYTNHCPRCLWSRHVDINPGDRAAKCNGLMEPIAVEGASPNYVVMHKCVKCGGMRRNKSVHVDSVEAIIRLAETSR